MNKIFSQGMCVMIIKKENIDEAFFLEIHLRF